MLNIEKVAMQLLAKKFSKIRSDLEAGFILLSF